jgi:hypothetical protein
VLNNIHYKLNVFQKNIKLAQWRSWRRRRRRLVVIRPKRGRTCSTTLWSHVHDNLAELIIICQELLVFLGEISCVLFQGHDILRLGARYWFGAPNSWDTTGRPQVLGRSVGEPVQPIFIESIERFDLHPQIRIEIRRVKGSSPYLSLNRLL